jgi:hypothetical protein
VGHVGSRANINGTRRRLGMGTLDGIVG